MEIAFNDPRYSDKAIVLTALHNVMDPELFVNIIDLGLVFNIEFKGERTIVITMTFSTRACPLSDSIKMGVRNVLSMAFPEYEVDIIVVWEPEWNFTMLTPEGRKLLGLDR
ncbi:metal-sulfur cluster assembly factor [Arachidicoccus soli]|uniref:Metal-sulfur cluster assembly factor n=1 Tax=Arachidicoccus soli TaxID=2341117 RepID=A0A386HSX0_9BACT|nr:metal-sulfur cluster assembly factor [Arachidicoccus soli]AYD48500.1 metal-sulfur cluster assembly factor [Arachidicoccus soli]